MRSNHRNVSTMEPMTPRKAAGTRINLKNLRTIQTVIRIAIQPIMALNAVCGKLLATVLTPSKVWANGELAKLKSIMLTVIVSRPSYPRVCGSAGQLNCGDQSNHNETPANLMFAVR